jgi:hypothetical protein
MCCKRWRRRSISTVAAQRGQLLAASVALLLACSALLAADNKVKELQDHFDRETHASGKIKTLEKLGAAQFASATKADQANDFTEAAFTLEKYRDNARAAYELLKKQEPDADHHPNSYRQLELQVRRAIREVEETIIIVPAEVRPPLHLVRQDLIQLDDTLIRDLFPRRTREPGPSAPPPPAPETNP